MLLFSAQDRLGLLAACVASWHSVSCVCASWTCSACLSCHLVPCLVIFSFSTLCLQSFFVYTSRFPFFVLSFSVYFFRFPSFVLSFSVYSSRFPSLYSVLLYVCSLLFYPRVLSLLTDLVYPPLCMVLVLSFLSAFSLSLCLSF